MTDNFDPDTFDWDGESQGINLNDVAPDILEAAVQAALNAHEQRYGWRYLKRSELKEGAGRLFRVKYYMPKEGKEFFEENFPGYTFVWDSALGHHDHPVAHLATELNELEMVESLVAGNTTYIDLFGNPRRNARYKRNCITLYTMATPKDYLRHQHPVAGSFVFDMEKLCDPDSVLGKIDNVCMTHSLYYVSMEDIGRILSVRKTRRVRALIHRHPETYGTLNAGEQEYRVDKNMTVEQVNVSTGEKYVHPSLEGLFHQGSARTGYGGVAWTIRKAGGDSYFVDFVGCPNSICEQYVPLRFLQPQSWEEYSYNNISVTKFLHWTWMSAKTSQGVIKIEDVDLFSKLRRYVAGKQRTPRLKTETVNYARRLCNKADIISIHGGGAHEIPVASMTDYVEVAFHVDQRTELDAALAFHKDNAQITHALNSYYETGTMPTDFTLVTGAAVKTSKMFSDAAIAVINTVRTGLDVCADDYVNTHLPEPDLARYRITNGEPGMHVPGPWW